MENTEFVPIKIDQLLENTILNIDIYGMVNNGYNQLCSKPIPIISDLITEIKDLTNGPIFIDKRDKELFNKYLERNLSLLTNKNDISLAEKTRIFYNIGTDILKGDFSNFGSSIELERYRHFISNLIIFLKSKPGVSKYFFVLKPKNHSIYNHSIGVASLSISLGIKIGLQSEGDLENLGIGALLHDIGMTTVPQRIVEKQDKLNNREFDIVKRHVKYGVEILSKVPGISKDIISAVQDHHERIDGKGYLFRKRGKEIHPFAKIIALIDVFDAITSKRPYRDASDPFPAIREIMTHQSGFEKKLLKLLILELGENN